MPNRVIAVTGGKGGVGKSTTTINLGVSLRMDGYSVALVDADVEMPNLVEMLGIEPEKTIHDVLSGTAETEDAIVEIAQDFVAIPGDSSLAGYGSIDPERLQEPIDALADDYDFVLLDTGAGLSYDDLLPMGLADEIVLVTSPDSAAIENAKRTQEFVSRLNREIRGLVVTKANGSVDGSIAEEFGTTILTAVPDDDVVSRSTAAGKPLEVFAPSSPAAQAYRQLEANLTDGVLPPQRSRPSKETSDDGATAPDDDDKEDDESPVDKVTAEEKAMPSSNDPPRRGGLIGRLVRLVT